MFFKQHYEYNLNSGESLLADNPLLTKPQVHKQHQEQRVSKQMKALHKNKNKPKIWVGFV